MTYPSGGYKSLTLPAGLTEGPHFSFSVGGWHVVNVFLTATFGTSLPYTFAGVGEGSKEVCLTNDNSNTKLAVETTTRT
jgi:hypothetical protein